MFYGLFEDKTKVSFSSFVDYALYSSKGFYNKHSTISKEGDFLTSPSISKIYAQTIVNFLISNGFRDHILINDKLESLKDEINLIELGSNEGILMKDVVDFIKAFWESEIYKKIKIIVIEKNVNLHKKIFKNLEEHQHKLTILNNLDEVNCKPKNAVVFCNEFFDALPFERCVIKNNKLYQINLKLKDKEFVELIDPADDFIDKKFAEYNLNFANDIFFEFPVVEYEKYFYLLSQKFSKIFFLINKYGDKSNYFHTTPDPFGTSRCFFNHSVNRNFYKNIFDQDITCDVNFSLLSLVAKKFNFIEDSFSTQTRFFLDNEWTSTPAFRELSTLGAEGTNIYKLIHPNAMGERFKFISFKF